MNVPLVYEVGNIQPFFVIYIFMTTYKKNTVSYSSLIEFSYSSKKYDIINNFQDVDWKYYRKLCSFYQKRSKIKYVSLSDIENKIKNIKRKKINNHIFHNFKGEITQNQKKGLDYVPNYYRNISDHCVNIWNECF